MAYRFFSDDELKCSCCGKSNPNARFRFLMRRIDILREFYGKPLKVTSAYRCPNHPLEAKKKQAGWHSVAAIDLAVSGKDAMELLRIAMDMRFGGIGISQKGDVNKRFIHLDDRKETAIWSY